ncbi:MAG: glutamine amidotransferase [Clostridia bacterium]|nr:glutamine amidotransferase [Clostridia bacterium]
MTATKALIVGESWTSVEAHCKGFDYFMTVSHNEGVKWLKEALEDGGISVDHLPSQAVATSFPADLAELKKYDVIMLSDIGSNSFLLHPDTYVRSQRTPNRLKLLRQYVSEGGGLCMIGGYMTFQGIDGRGRWHRTPVEECLPVTIHEYDDRAEAPEGFEPRVVDPEHPVLQGIPGEWPFFLGYNQVIAKPEAHVLLEHEGDPILAVGEYGHGRTMVFTSDCAPHWAPYAFLEWGHFGPFWQQAVNWLAQRA